MAKKLSMQRFFEEDGMVYSGLQGKVAIVTGTAGGIGRALVEAFVTNGLRVAALDLHDDPLSALQWPCLACLPKRERT